MQSSLRILVPIAGLLRSPDPAAVGRRLFGAKFAKQHYFARQLSIAST